MPVSIGVAIADRHQPSRPAAASALTPYPWGVQRAFVLASWVALAALATGVRAAGELGLPGEVALRSVLVGAGGPAGRAAALLSGLTGPIVWLLLVLVVCAALWIRGRRAGAFLLLAAQATAELVSLVLKAVIDRPRPAGAALHEVVATASFPSSHAVRTTVTIGVLLALAWRRPAWRLPAALAGGALLLLVGLARVAVGEHWPADVLGGYLLGVAWLGTGWILAARRARTRAV